MYAYLYHFSQIQGFPNPAYAQPVVGNVAMQDKQTTNADSIFLDVDALHIWLLTFSICFWLPWQLHTVGTHSVSK